MYESETSCSHKQKDVITSSSEDCRKRVHVLCNLLYRDLDRDVERLYTGLNNEHCPPNKPVLFEKKRKSICHLGLLYHYRVSSGLDVSHHSHLLPSSSLLGDLPKRHMWGLFIEAIRFYGSAFHDFTYFYILTGKTRANIVLSLSLKFIMNR